MATPTTRFTVNGKQVAKHRGHDTAFMEDVRSMLRTGENVLAIRCKNNAGPAATRTHLAACLPLGVGRATCQRDPTRLRLRKPV